jgi:hypothetical protein
MLFRRFIEEKNIDKFIREYLHMFIQKGNRYEENLRDIVSDTSFVVNLPKFHF